jgi:two-component system sensor histidine kinase ChvG
MASATATANPEPVSRPPRRRWRLPGSRLGRLIIALNVLGLAILIGGALVLNELSRGLINAEIQSLSTQGAFIDDVVEKAATYGDPQPGLDAGTARETLGLLSIPNSERVRVFDARGVVIADSYVLDDRVELRPLPPARKPGDIQFRWPFVNPDAPSQAAIKAHADLEAEIATALKGDVVAAPRRAQNGDRVVSVSIPIEHVQTVLGVLTLEAGDVDQIVAAQRRALAPFILVAVGATLLSSFLLSRWVTQPVLRLARAADSITLSRARAISLPDIAERDDEIGDLTRSLETMTSALSERMDAIERFAADVAHEIRNPLTSIRSAVETLDLVSDAAARERLNTILKQDVGRLDRLITDISNASRLDAELSRESPRRLDLERLLGDLAALYTGAAGAGEAEVRFSTPGGDPIVVLGREGPLSQVFRNLIDNARSFSLATGAKAPEVRLTLERSDRRAIAAVEDDGPGLPAENLETVFERFYTARPAGAAFGGHSGLGLSIARQIVGAHGGEIHAENRLDADGRVLGARFVVSLPLARP